MASKKYLQLLEDAKRLHIIWFLLLLVTSPIWLLIPLLFLAHLGGL